ncbi:MAG: hypothetical protein AAGE96_05715 [Cyanobacteria bacterium P01_G01_bin.19]
MNSQQEKISLAIDSVSQRLLRRADWSPPTSLREGESLQRLTKPALTVGQDSVCTIYCSLSRQKNVVIGSKNFILFFLMSDHLSTIPIC